MARKKKPKIEPAADEPSKPSGDYVTVYLNSDKTWTTVVTGKPPDTLSWPQFAAFMRLCGIDVDDDDGPDAKLIPSG